MQPDDKECGYYVRRLINEIITNHNESKSLSEVYIYMKNLFLIKNLLFKLIRKIYSFCIVYRAESSVIPTRFNRWGKTNGYSIYHQKCMTCSYQFVF
jgi:hypothetical protein